MSRITLDVIMATGFDLKWDAADLHTPCPLLDDMHFLMAETFRRAQIRPIPKPCMLCMHACYVHARMFSARCRRHVASSVHVDAGWHVETAGVSRTRCASCGARRSRGLRSRRSLRRAWPTCTPSGTASWRRSWCGMQPAASGKPAVACLLKVKCDLKESTASRVHACRRAARLRRMMSRCGAAWPKSATPRRVTWACVHARLSPVPLPEQAPCAWQGLCR